jgi:hypothetical protein
MSQTADQTTISRPSDRSRTYPRIDLQEAIQRAETVYNKEKQNATPVETLANHWNYSVKSSGFQGVFSALKQFGLLEQQGQREDRTGHLTSLAITLLRAPEQEKSEAMWEAAMSPTIHAILWDRYGEVLPSSKNLIRTLQKEYDFSEPGATILEREYRQTLAFVDSFCQTGDDNADTEPVDRVEHEAIRRTSDSSIELPLSTTIVPPFRTTLLLDDGQQVVLEGNFPVSEGAFETLLAVLQAMRPGLVRPNERTE